MENLNYNPNCFKSFLLNYKISHTENLDLATLSFINAGGISRFFVEPKNQNELLNLIAFLNEKKISFLIIGNLSNTLFRDGTIYTILISTKYINNILYKNDLIEVEAGVLLPQLAYKLTKEGYIGFAGLTGFPATIGGAIYMNASCYDSCISDKLLYVDILNEKGLIERWDKDKFNFKWRYSILHDLDKKFIILSATFTLEIGNLSILKNTLSKIKAKRLTFQEHRNPNLGSIFATENIYKEITKKNIIYLLFYYQFLIFSKIFLKKYPLIHAHFLNKLTQIFFNVYNNKIKFSYYTFNCIINKNNNNADDLIRFIRYIHKKIKYCVKIEIIIYDKIN